MDQQIAPYCLIQLFAFRLFFAFQFLILLIIDDYQALEEESKIQSLPQVAKNRCRNFTEARSVVMQDQAHLDYLRIRT